MVYFVLIFCARARNVNKTNDRRRQRRGQATEAERSRREVVDDDDNESGLASVQCGKFSRNVNVKQSKSKRGSHNFSW